MNFRKYIIAFLMSLAFIVNGEDVKSGKILFEDKFENSKIKEDWTVESGKWEIKDGALFNREGGTITLKKPCENFIFEADVKISEWIAHYPWVSIAFAYEDENNNSHFMVTPGETYYYIKTTENKESTSIAGTKIPFAKENFHHVKIVCAYNIVSVLWDKTLLASANVDCSADRIAFIGNSDGADFEIKDVKISEIIEVPGKVIKEFKRNDFAQGQICEDYKFKTIEANKKPTINDSSVFLTYDFTDDKEFRGTFLRIPVSVEKVDKICLTLNGDASKNRFFIIVHDKSGEQHLVQAMPLAWSGAHDIKVDLKRFFQAPPDRVINATHWDGDKNQKIDLPITKLDIGICKRERAVKPSGKIEIKDLRFEE